MKKFWKYFTILILLLIGLFCAGLLYLFFVPSAELFGIKYISLKKDVYTQEYSAEAVDTIVLNSRSYNVNVITSSNENIKARLNASTSGFVHKDNSVLDINYNLSGGVLTINIIEPYGVVFKNNSHIDLIIPEASDVTLKLTNHNAETTINSEKINLTGLIYKTKFGEFNFEKGTISHELTLDIDRAEFNISKDVVLNDVQASIKFSSGKLNAENSEFKSIEVIENSSGVIKAKRCEKITSKMQSAGGSIQIAEVINADIESSDTNINIEKLSGGSIILTHTGSINIKTINGICSLKTNSGSINIQNANASIETNSESGDQAIKNATKQIIATTSYGNIEVEFSDLAGSYIASDTHPCRSLLASTKSGKITAKGVHNITLAISDNGRANIEMKNVLGENVITGGRGEVYVKVPNASIYHLKTQSTEKGSVYVNLTQLPVEGYRTTELTENWVNCAQNATLNKLYIMTTSGSLTLVDELNA